ncbi:NAD(P)/FAD-dependent oxidoreductase [Aerococcaceae bacterium NML171108]|nr:NAD(P)/FAD-dependent oxidoreductase [Aerococcaceae bacterium NML171108]
MELYDITIIGGGPVGMFTAFYAELRQAKTKIIESLELLGGQPAHLYPEKLIYDIPAFPAVTGEQLTHQLEDQLARFETTICLGEEALNLSQQQTPNGESYFEITTNKATHYSRTVILAAGNGAFRPRKLDLPNATSFEEANLHYFVKNVDHFAGKKVAICGGGDSAVDWALTLEPIAEKVYLIHRRPQFRALEHSVQLLHESSVEVLTPFVPHELVGNERIEQLIINESRTENYQTLDIDEFIVSYGFTSSIGAIKHWGFETQRNTILTNHQFATSIPGIFAVGDIAQYEGKVQIIATGFGEAPLAVNQALQFINPERKPQHIHSTSLFD